MKGEIDMKKYVKPELCYESFELSEQIATGCSSNLIVNHADIANCFVPNYEGTALFVNTNSSCKDEFEGYCYTAGADGFSIFTS